jgi:hypothetical protein
MSDSTKATPADTKMAKPVTNRHGRPRLGDRPLSPAERSRRARARKRQAKPAPPIETQMAGVTKEAVLADLIESRGLTSPLHKSIAAKIADAFVRDDPNTASRWMDFLPPMRAETGGPPTVSASGARKRVLELILNRIGADRIERAARVEAHDPTLTEREMLQFRIDQIDEQVASNQGEEGDEPDDEITALRAEVERLRLLVGEALPLADD